MTTHTFKVNAPRWADNRRDANRAVIIYVDRALRGSTDEERMSARGMVDRCRPMLDAALDKLMIPRTAKVTWVKTAGCACCCSPGFKVSGWNGRTVFVEAIKLPEQLPLFA